MNVPHRHSILHRPVRAEAKANVENIDAEYQKERQRIAARAERLASTEDRLIKSFYGTEAEKRSGWENTQQELEQYAHARQAAAAQERQLEEQWLSQPQQVFVDTRRPWTAHSTTYYLSREEEAEARRRAQGADAEENRVMMQYRSFHQQQEREMEREAIQKTIESEDAWFNLGAASERWIPPERRIKQRAVVPPQFAMGPAPYHCDAAAGAAARPSTAPAAGMSQAPPPTRRSAFWERESGQGVKSALSHDVYFQAEQAARQQPVQQARGQPRAPSHSPAPSQASTRSHAAQAPRPQQQRYPWSWDA